MSGTVAVAHLKSRSLIALSGPDWRSFLQGLISQDVETLPAGEARFGALLTPQGRLLYDLFVVGRDEGGAWLDVEAEHRAALIQRLTMYRLRAKVEIAADETPVSVLFSQDAHSPLPLAGRGLGEGVSAPSPVDSTPTPGPSPQGGGEALSSTQGLWVQDPRLPALGLRGYGVSPPSGAVAVDEAAREAQKLRLGVPGPADWGSDKTYPIEANFDLLNGIDFKKGCFVGQETTSRMKRRGQVKSRMLPLRFEGPALAAGAEVLNGELRAGVVTSSADGGAIALLRLDRALGAALTVDGRPVTAEVPAWMAGAVGEAMA